MPSPGPNPSLVGYKALNQELGVVKTVVGEGALAGVAELATGGSKVKAVWESIKWGTLARAGLAGFAGLLIAANALTFGIRKVVLESGALQAAMERLNSTKILSKTFEAFLGSVVAAKARVQELYAFAATSRFDFTEIVNASRTLTAFTNGVMGGYHSLEQLGKIATATNTPLEDLAGAVGQANNAIRNGNDFSGPIASLKAMGVISEGTEKRLKAMAEQGASTAAILDQFNESVKTSSENLGETEKSVADLESEAAKAQTTLMAAFGADFVERHRREVELTGKVYQNFTGIAGKVGQMLAQITAPFDNIRTVLKEISATKGFASVAGQVAQVAVAMGPVLAGWAVIKGIGKLAETGADVFNKGGTRGVANRVKGVFSPSSRAQDWSDIAGRLAKNENVPTFVTKGAELIAKGWAKVADLLPFVSSGFTKLGSILLRFAGPAAVVITVGTVLAKLWEKYNEEVSKAARLTDMSDDIKKTSEALGKQVSEIKNYDDYLQALTTAQNNYNAALEKQAAIEADTSKTPDERHAAEAGVATARKELNRVARMDTTGFAPGKAEIEAAIQRREIEKQIRDIIFESQVARASDGEKAVLLAQRQAEYEKIAADYRKSEAAQPDIQKAAQEYEAAGGTDERKARVAQNEVNRLQGELDKAQPGALQPEHVAGSTAEKKQKQLEYDLERAKDDLAAASQGPEKETKRAKYLEALRKGGKADQFEAAAIEVESGPGDKAANAQQAARLRAEAANAKIVSKQEAEEQSARLREQRIEVLRGQQMTGIGQEYQKQALGVTSRTYQGADVLARQRIAENRERFAEQTKNYNPETTDEVAKKAYAQQKEAVELENKQIQKEIDERAYQLGVEKAAWDTRQKVSELNNTAITAAANGHFAEATAALVAARTASDMQAQIDRANELRLQGYDKEATASIVAAEQKQREADRKAKAEAYQVQEERRVKEQSLELGVRGLQVPGGEKGPVGPEARQELIKMRDADAFREQLAKNLDNMPDNPEKARDLALQSVSADILKSQQVVPGENQVADSMTRIGGGGGIYAGEGSDPQLAAANRIAALAEEAKNQRKTANQLLEKIEKKLAGGVN